MSTKLPIRKIVAAIDLEDELAGGVLSTAQALSERMGANLQIIDIWPQLELEDFPHHALAEAMGEPREMEAHERRAVALSLKAKINAPNAEVKTMSATGPTAATITNFLVESGAELLVIGTHQKGFWKRMFSGSVSEDVAHSAPCPIFMVPPTFSKQMILENDV